MQGPGKAPAFERMVLQHNPKWATLSPDGTQYAAQTLTAEQYEAVKDFLAARATAAYWKARPAKKRTKKGLL